MRTDSPMAQLVHGGFTLIGGIMAGSRVGDTRHPNIPNIIHEAKRFTFLTKPKNIKRAIDDGFLIMSDLGIFKLNRAKKVKEPNSYYKLSDSAIHVYKNSQFKTYIAPQYCGI